MKSIHGLIQHNPKSNLEHIWLIELRPISRKPLGIIRPSWGPNGFHLDQQKSMLS